MLPGQKRTKPNFHDIVEDVFSIQTLNTKNGHVHFAKEDIQSAREAYDKYSHSKTIEDLLLFQKAVAICKENSRSGFDKVAGLLLNHPLLKEVDSAQKNDHGNKL